MILFIFFSLVFAKRRVWIDTDPGNGDALALVYALFQEQIEIIGISTIQGSQSIDEVTDNAIRILGNFGGFKIPLIKGLNIENCHPSLQQMHGAQLFDVNFVPIQNLDPQKELAIQVIHRSQNEPFTLILLGPHKNFGSLLKNNNITNIDEIIIVAGEAGKCDINISIDPESSIELIEYAQFNSIPLTIIPLSISLTDLQLQQLVGTKLSKWVLGLLSEQNNEVKEVLAIYYIVNQNKKNIRTSMMDVEIVQNLDCKGLLQFNGLGSVKVLREIKFSIHSLMQSIENGSRIVLFKN